jgi:hypothetical protein
MSDEKFDIKKFAGSFFQLIPWVKDMRTVIAIVIIVTGGYTIWRAYIMPKNKQVQQTQIHIDPGGVLNLQQNQKVEEKKRAWWIPGVFVEAYGFTEHCADLSIRTGLGGKGGLRWDW